MVWGRDTSAPVFPQAFTSVPFYFALFSRRFQAAKFRRAATEYDFQCQRRCARQCVLAPKETPSALRMLERPSNMLENEENVGEKKEESLRCFWFVGPK